MTDPAPIANRPHALVFGGGADAERPISLLSAAAVAAGLHASGRWDTTEYALAANDPDEVRHVLEHHRPDVVLPILHGPWGEGGHLQRHLEAAGVPYVGSRPLAADLAMDKQRTKDAAASVGVPVIDGVVVDAAGGADLPAVAARLTARLGPHIVTKPVDDGSSIDLFITEGTEALADVLVRMLAGDPPHRRRALVERCVRGRELTVGLVAGEALPIMEIRPAAGVYDFEAKYERHDTQYVVNPDLPAGVADAAVDAALRVSRALGLRDLARVDFLLDGMTPRLLEANTMPGFTATSLLPQAAAAAGLAMPALCDRLASIARRRGSRAARTEAAVNAPGG